MTATTTKLEKFDLGVKDFDPYNIPPFGCLFGGQNVGKTLEAARAFPDYYWVTPDVSGLRTWADVIDANPEKAKQLGWRIPKKVKMLFDTRNEKGDPLHNWHKQWKSFVRQWVALKRAGKNTYNGLVVDGMDTWIRWMFRDIKGGKITGGTMTWASLDLVKDVIELAAAEFRAVDTGVIFIGQRRNPTFHKKDSTKLVYPGGFCWPIGTMVHEASISMDFAWEVAELRAGKLVAPKVEKAPDQKLEEEGPDDTVEIEDLGLVGVEVEADPLTGEEAPDPIGIPKQTTRVLLTKTWGDIIRKTRGDRGRVPPVVSLEEKSVADLLRELRFKNV